MKETNRMLIIAAMLVWASTHLGAGQTACCADDPAAAARPAPGHDRSDNVSFYKVPLVCPAAPHIGCGSASKPLLLELEHNDVVSEAWLNRAGTVMAIVWTGQLKQRQRAKTLKTIFKARDMTVSELTGEPKEEAARDFQSGKGWYRGAEVDRLSEEEAGVIANRWIGRFHEKIVLPDEKAKILQEAFTAQLKLQLTGKSTREETKKELLRVARQNLDEKDVKVLLQNFGDGFRPREGE